MKIRYSLLFIVMLIGCQKPILDVTKQLTWKTEPLNGEYTIQFPGGYEGPGMVGFEGPTFGKNRIDKQVTFGYFFCGPTTCGPYGQPIIKPYGSSFPSTIVYANRTLNKSITFKRDGQLQAVFYFSEKIEAQGVLFLKEIKSGLLRESLNVSYPYDQQAEVLSILQTIQPK